MKLQLPSCLKNGLRIPNFRSQLKYVSTQAQKCKVQNEKNELSQTLSQSVKHSRKKLLFSPVLSKSSLEKLQNVTAIVVAMNHVSWAKVSVQSPSVLDWDAHALPRNFMNDFTEPDILEIAHKVKKQIPSSELFVMETQLHNYMRFPSYISLKSMLTVLLSDINYDPKYPNIVFQKPQVMNTLNSLLVGGERTSARKVLEEKHFLKFFENRDKSELCETSESHSTNLLNKLLNDFPLYSKEKQESMSVALVLAVSFLDVNVFQNSKSLAKMSGKAQPK